MTLLASVTETQRTVFEFARVPPAWGQVAGVAVLVALCYVVVALYQRERRTGAGPVLRIGLAGLRCIVLLALAVIWLAPVNATYVVRSIPGQVAVLLDASASMSVRDDLGAAPADDSNESASRLSACAPRLLADDSQWLRRLAVRNELSVYAFGDDVQRLLHAPDAQSLAAQLDPLRPSCRCARRPTSPRRLPPRSKSSPAARSPAWCSSPTALPTAARPPQRSPPTPADSARRSIRSALATCASRRTCASPA